MGREVERGETRHSGRSNGGAPHGWVVLLLFLWVLPGSLFAQVEGEDEPDRDRRSSDPTPASTRAIPLQGSIEVDGRLEEEAWTSAPPATGFVAQEPTEGAPPEEPTEVYVLYGDDALYVGARLFESDPTRITDQLVRRDQRGNFDFFAVLLDSNLDRRTGFYFQVSAAGVKTDRLLFDDTEEDESWDAVWETSVARNSEGWTAEMRIPYSQIRYEPSQEEQAWGINFFRRRVVSNEVLHFSLVSRLQDGQVSQFGLLEGLYLPDSPGGFELLPFLSSQGRTAPSDSRNPFFDGQEMDVEFGGEVTWRIGSNFNLNTTFNPDFGQVESDPAVINLTAFETFFEERRPFFVEDRQLFDFELSGRQNSLFFSRRIGLNPAGSAPQGADFSQVPDATTILSAAKLTGRTSSGLSVGALGAFTEEETGRAFFLEDGRTEEFVVQPSNQWGVLSLEQDFNGGDSNVGAMFVGLNRELTENATHEPLPSSAFAGGLNFIHRWSDREWALFGFFATSHVRGDTAAILRVQTNSNHFLQRPDKEWAEIDSTATHLTGVEWRLQFERQRGEHWTGAVWLGEVSPQFAINDVGFSRNTERLDAGARLSYREIDPGDVLRSWNVNFFTFHNWSHDVLADPWSPGSWRDAQTSGSFNLNANFELLNFWEIEPRFTFRPDTYSRTLTRGGPVMIDPGSWEIQLGLNTDRRKAINFRPQVSYEERKRDGGSTWEVGIGSEFRPTSNVEIQLNPRFERQLDNRQFVASSRAVPFEPTFGGRHLFSDVDRRTFSLETRVDMAFTPDLTLQLFAQPFISTGDFLAIKQLADDRTFDFDRFAEGEVVELEGGEVACRGGRTCVDDNHVRHMDFQGDGAADFSFRDPDFNFRSLIVNAVLRWEFRNGSRLFVVWQRFQDERAPNGDFQLGRDLGNLFGAQGENIFTIKVDFWVGF